MKSTRLALLSPTGNFAALLFILGAMWYAASSQNSPAVYFLLFMLGAIFLVSIPQTLFNTKGLTITLESAKPAFAGQEIALPIEIINKSRRARYAIEVSLSGAARARERVDYLPGGKAARVTLRFLANARGQHEIGCLVLSSVYPLGFVRASRKLAAARSYLVYPKPAGNLPLPGSRALRSGERAQPDLEEGDDFAGLREYVPGESQRHIDWKAVARGQPLMIKQFAAETDGALCLDFSCVPVADVEQRLSQLALWVIEAERTQHQYGLRLPGTNISPGRGYAHFHRCLRALSLFPGAKPQRPTEATAGAGAPGSVFLRTKQKSAAARQSTRDTSIPRRPMLWLTGALLFTLPPMYGSLASWAPTLFLLTLALKFWMEPRGYHLRLAAIKMLLVVIALGAVFLSYGSLSGVEPGVSILVVLTSLKILEAHTAREFQVMVMMAWILCLFGFFLSQEFGSALFLLVAFVLSIAALVQFHRGSSPGGFGAPLATTCKLLAPAAPIVALLFVLFPRITTGFRFDSHDLRLAKIHFSEQISPGSVAALASSSEVAFRAEFPETRPTGPLYWRGVVMWHCDGMEWRAPNPLRPIPNLFKTAPAGQPFRQQITLAPHGAHWMFALDRPFQAPAGAILADGNCLWSFPAIRKARRYEVISFSEASAKELSAYERRVALETPRWITPAVRELAQSWAASNSNPRAVIQNALQFFRTRGFRYSLSPGEYKKTDLEEFLFRRRTGFCEHYAAVFATLMRLAGIPSRVVAGYLGGEYNDLGRFYIVRQADAHAWCEVWLPQSGWTRVDPTGVVAPGRASFDLNSFLETRIATGQLSPGRNAFVVRLSRWAIVNRLRLAWEALNYEWDTRILGFDADVQEALLRDLGIANRGTFSLVGQTAILVVAILIIYTASMQLRNRPRVDKAKALYERFCQKLASAGVRRSQWEGPLDFARRAAEQLPHESERIRAVSHAYIALRYAREPGKATLERFARNINAFCG